MGKYVIMGLGDFTEIVFYMMTQELGLSVGAFCVDEVYLPENRIHHGLPVYAFETIEQNLQPEEHVLVLAFLGNNMFAQREERFCQAKKKGFCFENIIHPSANISNAVMGVGNIILEEVLISYFAVVGDCNVFWSRSMVQHHNRVGSFNLLAPNCSTSGYVEIRNHCFIGNNSTVKNRVRIEDGTFVGADAYVTGDTQAETVIVPPRSYALEGKKGSDFM